MQSVNSSAGQSFRFLSARCSQPNSDDCAKLLQPDTWWYAIVSAGDLGSWLCFFVLVGVGRSARMVGRLDVLFCVAGCPNREIFHALEVAAVLHPEGIYQRSFGAQGGGWGGFWANSRRVGAVVVARHSCGCVRLMSCHAINIREGLQELLCKVQHDIASQSHNAPFGKVKVTSGLCLLRFRNLLPFDRADYATPKRRNATAQSRFFVPVTTQSRMLSSPIA